jgi:hypothetical protein
MDIELVMRIDNRNKDFSNEAFSLHLIALIDALFAKGTKLQSPTSLERKLRIKKLLKLKP